ncbi:hypothetical protein [Candidatus Poriferisocius sp.]|uniref:hypothetical protein n=1 Tax=Candidatus Poriferisocius sp. TaxID=3101276 RepID=UPI003B51A8F2
MAKRSKAARKGNSPNEALSELKTLLIGYGRQEIVTPLTQLGKTLKLGILGALSIGVGLVFLSIAGLRLLQTEASGVFDGNMSALPYLVVLVGLLSVLAVLVATRTRISRGGRS